VTGAFPDALGNSNKQLLAREPTNEVYGKFSERGDGGMGRGDSGSASRFFYSAKADAADRCGSKHPTVKPVDLMAYLVRLVTPPGGVTLDPFAGSGSTGMACLREGFDCILIEREAQYVADIHRRLAHVEGADAPLFAPKPVQPDIFTEGKAA
jgi:site-specific DNA-methyltransferase (adenine-specific)